jgi:surfactin synthase thioesterase subunit
MAGSKKEKSSNEKVRAYRERLRRQGLRPIQIWVPDVRAPGFLAEAHRQSAAVAESTESDADQEFIDAISDLGTASMPRPR